MVRITFEDGTKMHIDDARTLVSNKGPVLVSEIEVGAYIRCGAAGFCRVVEIATIEE